MITENDIINDFDNVISEIKITNIDDNKRISVIRRYMYGYLIKNKDANVYTIQKKLLDINQRFITPFDERDLSKYNIRTFFEVKKIIQEIEKC